GRVAPGTRVGRVLVTGSMSASVDAVARPGALLIGAAAGFYDPFTGEGLSYALRSAELAAETVEAALSGGLGRARGQGSGVRGQRSARSFPDPWPLTPDPCSPASVEAAAFREYAARRRAEF